MGGPAPLRALIIDSWFDPYHGAVVMMRVFDGTVAKGERIRMMYSGRSFEVTRLGVFAPVATEVGQLSAGEVGFLMAGIKEVSETRIGDTITLDDRPVTEPLPGFKPMKPMVFSGLYPTEANQYQSLRDALEKLSARSDTFLLGVCNGCQMVADLAPDLVEATRTTWPRFVRNRSERFEARVVLLRIERSPHQEQKFGRKFGTSSVRKPRAFSTVAKPLGTSTCCFR